jgi:ribosomal protein S18 acetylase RimI-like enzyme
VITAADVTALVAAFREIARIPRLEYVVSSAPDLEQQLVAAGFAVEARHDYLVCSPDSLVVPAVPAGIEMVEPATDDERADLAAAQGEAFGGEVNVTPADVARMRRNQDNGAVVLLARVGVPDGASYCVGGGQASAPAAGTSEVAGIAVREAYRRRGIAGAVTASITERLFAKGLDAAWLEASGQESWRVYERVGYVATGKRLYIALDN